jgi:hypothetical protein
LFFPTTGKVASCKSLCIQRMLFEMPTQSTSHVTDTRRQPYTIRLKIWLCLSCLCVYCASLLWLASRQCMLYVCTAGCKSLPLFPLLLPAMQGLTI